MWEASAFGKDLVIRSYIATLDAFSCNNFHGDPNDRSKKYADIPLMRMIFFYNDPPQGQILELQLWLTFGTEAIYMATTRGVFLPPLSAATPYTSIATFTSIDVQARAIRHHQSIQISNLRSVHLMQCSLSGGCVLRHTE